MFAVERNGRGAVVGPAFSRVGTVGEAHELGATYKGQEFDKRPFMGLALEQNVDRMAPEWLNTVGE